ncbi:hypothetical protein FNV43_RR00382 [Rhamnella rubrinervis]|uniref:very-long-chain 3-oxoacyl-CoA synthase n=1 Tax=Rhamnella rubrinervis TaxID=2594499 RepID=A0A8K0HNJ7_9ROSA|nr:hypothetical protein FNV43_RR00382 [Rhamnella rubrinervis]
MLDFACYKPPSTQKCSRDVFLDRVRVLGNFTESNIEFMQRILERSGLGQSTYVSNALLRDSINPSMEEARSEAQSVIFGAVDQLLEKTGLKGEEIRIVIVNCSIFNPLPSLSAMIVNRYKLRENVLSYNLGGMGCGASLAAIGLARQLLQVHRNSYALVVSTENITQNFYPGNDHSKLLTNCLFRVGGAAILLSNHPSDRNVAKYELIHTVHTHTARLNRSYSCVFQEEDHQGNIGVTIDKHTTAMAMNALEINIYNVARLVLPVSEQILYITNYIMRYLRMAEIKPYIPNFKKVVEHVLPQVGTRPILEELQRRLGFNRRDLEACRMTLYRFGNMSSSTIWYELAYSEAKGWIKRGDRVWHITFGSGFTCNSAIWRAIRSVDREDNNPWTDEIDEFPIFENNVLY